jgi:hypothetical protein
MFIQTFPSVCFFLLPDHRIDKIEFVSQLLLNFIASVLLKCIIGADNLVTIQSLSVVMK